MVQGLKAWGVDSYSFSSMGGTNPLVISWALVAELPWQWKQNRATFSWLSGSIWSSIPWQSIQTLSSE
jgi:hypothetical protein